MANHKVYEKHSLHHAVMIHRNKAYGVYIVSLRTAVGNELSSYHTDDKDDSIDTAIAMLKEADDLLAQAEADAEEKGLAGWKD